MTILKFALDFLVAIGILVAVHEFGHYWVAKKLGFKVLRFSIGFGKPLLTYVGHDADRTEYSARFLDDPVNRELGRVVTYQWGNLGQVEQRHGHSSSVCDSRLPTPF